MRALAHVHEQRTIMENKHTNGSRSSTTGDRATSGSAFAEVVPDALEGSPETSQDSEGDAPSDSRFEVLHEATYDLVRKALACIGV